MILSQLKIALRKLKRHPLSTTINLVGLAIGIAGCLGIFTILDYEFQFDRYRTDRDRIYRVYATYSAGFDQTTRGISLSTADFLSTQLTDETTVAPFVTLRRPVLIPGPEPTTHLAKFCVADQRYFEVFSDYQWLAGNPTAALAAPNQVVLTASQAERYFGNIQLEDLLGKELIYLDSFIMQVSGIVADPQSPTDLVFTDFISFRSIEVGTFKEAIQINDGWGANSSSHQVFLRLGPEIATGNVEQALTTLEAHMEENELGDPDFGSFELQPFADLHFQQELGTFDIGRAPADLSEIRMLGLVALLLLLLAVFNFVNLETARSSLRTTEVGVRKALGSTRWPLITQFLAEALLLTSGALALGLLFTWGAFGLYPDFIPKGVEFDFLDFRIWMFALLLLPLVTLLSGVYPAWITSRPQAVDVLRNTNQTSGRKRSTTLRRVLIVVQFAIAQLFLFGTLTYTKQLQFMLNKDLGINPEGIAFAWLDYRQQPSERQAILSELARIPGVESVSNSTLVPMSGMSSRSNWSFINQEDTINLNVYTLGADTAFLGTYEMELVAGQNFSEPGAAGQLIINEQLCRELGISPLEAIGLKCGANEQVVGVVGDYHQHSLRSSYKPVLISYRPSGDGYTANVRMAPAVWDDPQNRAQTLAKLQQTGTQLSPDNPLKFTDYSAEIRDLYESNIQTAQLATGGTVLIILIAGIGLFGLISFSVNRRKKELGIRKVLGASVQQLLSLLSQEFIILVAIAASIALPFGYYFLQQTLDEFAFRTAISWWLYLSTLGITLLLCLVTVCARSYLAATSNPSETLRKE